MGTITTFMVVVLLCSNFAYAQRMTAGCSMFPDMGHLVDPVNGDIELSEFEESSSLIFLGSIWNASIGLHGLSIHENLPGFGPRNSTGYNCTAAGPHYNPFNRSHGNINDTERHVGDLGNVESNANRTAEVYIEDDVSTLFGNMTIGERSLVLHELPDDLGKGGHNDSSTTGHAGEPLACCPIKLHRPIPTTTKGAMTTTATTATAAVTTTTETTTTTTTITTTTGTTTTTTTTASPPTTTTTTASGKASALFYKMSLFMILINLAI